MTTNIPLHIIKKGRAISAPSLVANNIVANNKFNKIFALSALVLSITACQGIPAKQQGPVVASPNVPLDSAQGYQIAGNQQVPSSLASIRWQSFYTDPKLKHLIKLGLDNNKDIKQAVLAIRKAEAQYRITDNKDLPTIGANAEYSRSATNFRDKNPGDNYTVGLGLAGYELDFWGKISSLKDQALQNYLATNAAKDTAQVSLIANIAKSYVNLSYQLQQLDLAARTLKSREKSLMITQARLKAGIDPKTPSLQAAASVESARIAMLNAQSGVTKARNALSYLVGAPITDDLMPAPAVSSIAITDIEDGSGLPSELLRYRPDILQAEYRLKAAGANIDVARAAYFPSISLTGRLGYSSNDLSDLFKSGASSWSFGPQISIPIFDAGQLDSNYEVAQIEQQQALANYERSIETAFKEVNDVLAVRETLKERTQSQYRLQKSYDGIYFISQERFKAQIDDYLSVLDAERALFSTQQNILNLELENLINQIELYQALGGGANLVDGVTVPTSNNRNLVHILDVPTDEKRKEQALKATSPVIVMTNEEVWQMQNKNLQRPQSQQAIASQYSNMNKNNASEADTNIELTTYPPTTIKSTNDGSTE